MRLLFFSREAESGQLYIFAAINHKGERVKFGTGVKVAQSKWVQESKKIKGGGFEAAKITSIEHKFNEFIRSNPEASIETIADHLTGKEAEKLRKAKEEKKRLKAESELSLVGFIEALPAKIIDTYNRKKGETPPIRYH